MKTWSARFLLVALSLLALPFSAQAQMYHILSPTPAASECAFKKLNGKAWEPADVTLLAGKAFPIMKDFPATNTVLVKSEEVWYAVSKKCVDIPPGVAPVITAPTPAPQSAQAPAGALAGTKHTSKYLMLGYRKDALTLVTATGVEAPLDETWIGVTYGFEKHIPWKNKWEWKWGGDAQFGVGNVKPGAKTPATISYSVSMVTVLGVHPFAGVSYRLNNKWILSFQPGLILRWGPYPLPTDNSFKSISTTNMDPVIGFSQDYYWSPKFSIRAEEGILTKSSSLFIGAGVGFKVW